MSILSNWIPSLKVGGETTGKTHFVSVYTSLLKDGMMQGAIIFRKEVLEPHEVGGMYANLSGHSQIQVEEGAKLNLELVFPGYHFVDPKVSEKTKESFISPVTINQCTPDLPFWFRVNEKSYESGLKLEDIKRRMGQVKITFQTTNEILAAFNLWDHKADNLPQPRKRKRFSVMDPCDITGKTLANKRVRLSPKTFEMEETMEIVIVRRKRTLKINSSVGFGFKVFAWVQSNFFR